MYLMTAGSANRNDHKDIDNPKIVSPNKSNKENVTSTNEANDTGTDSARISENVALMESNSQ